MKLGDNGEAFFVQETEQHNVSYFVFFIGQPLLRQLIADYVSQMAPYSPKNALILT